MTETELWVNGACHGLVRDGRVRLYRDLYKDLREKLPCGEACRLIEAGLRLTRLTYLPGGGLPVWNVVCDRARAVAALKRLARYADLRDSRYWKALGRVSFGDWKAAMGG